MIIGLTGGIASGKSTVSAMIRTLNIPVVDADQIAREVVMPGESAYQQILEVFGEDVVDKDRTLNRKRLGSIIFNDEKKRRLLNGIVHPAVRQQMLSHKNELLKKSNTVVMDIPLLFESKLTHMVDRTMLVYVDPNIQLTRLIERDGSTEKEALTRIQSQLSLEIKRDWVDEVIDNNGTFENSKRQLLHIFTKWNIL